MQILHVIHQYLPDHIGGSELYTRWLSEAQATTGHDVAVFHRRWVAGMGTAERTENGVRIVSAWDGEFSPVRRVRATFSAPKLAQMFEDILNTHQPEIVHVEHLMGLPVKFAEILSRRKIPFVVTLWDFWWVCANAQLFTNFSGEVCNGPDGVFFNCARCALARAGQGNWWPLVPAVSPIFALRNRRLRTVMAQAARLIAPTPFVARWYGKHGTSTNRVAVLPPGMPVPPKTVREKNGRAPVRFGYLGGISTQKGVHIAIEAFSQVSGNAELWIAGDDTVFPDYAARLRTLADERVRFWGKLSRAEVWQTLAQLDVLIVPSMWYETFAFVISEAFAAGVPVIASDLGPLADRVRHGAGGFLFPPGAVDALADILQKLLADPSQIQQLRANIHPENSLAEHVSAVDKLYQQAISAQ